MNNFRAHKQLTLVYFNEKPVNIRILHASNPNRGILVTYPARLSASGYQITVTEMDVGTSETTRLYP